MCDGQPASGTRGHFWVSVRVFLVPDDVLHMRTTALREPLTRCCGGSGEFFRCVWCQS